MEYVEFNNNPKGKKTTDCVLRAISFAMEKDYIETYKDMVEFSIKKGIFISDNKFSKTYLKSKNIETQKILHLKKKIKRKRELFCIKVYSLLP